MFKQRIRPTCLIKSRSRDLHKFKESSAACCFRSRLDGKDFVNTINSSSSDCKGTETRRVVGKAEGSRAKLVTISGRPNASTDVYGSILEGSYL